MRLHGGDRIWQAIVHVSLVQVMPEVRPLTVLRRVDDEQVHVIDERSGYAHQIEESDINSRCCSSEHEAWEACEFMLRRIAQQCVEHAARCNSRKVVSRVVA
jgi:hypothetical protein